MPVQEITLESLLDDYDWAQVFADENAGNVSKKTQRVPPWAPISDTPASRSDVEKIIAAVNGENDGEAWVGVFLLKDGRYLVAEGSCDYTGWDCQAGNSMCVAPTLVDAIRLGLNDEQRCRLGLRIDGE